MKRPIPVTIISCLLIATGALGFVFHLADVTAQHSFQSDEVWAALVNLAAILCGVYMLRAGNWARWLAIAWIGFHVIVSIFHSRSELAAHILIFAAFGYFLFRPRANDYFRGAAA